MGSQWVVRTGRTRGEGDYLVEIGYLPRVAEFGAEQHFAHRFDDRNTAKNAARSCIEDHDEPARVVRLRPTQEGHDDGEV